MKSALKQKKYPVGYTSKDIEFLKKQKEDVVRYEDLDKKGQEIWKKQGKPVPKPKKKKKTPLEQKIEPYWYKIGGKTVTKAKYNAYDNPVGDGPTKTTNDPDPAGRIARTQAAREKLPKRATVLTEAQTRVKDQGTKLKKRPPLLSKKEDFKTWADKQIKSGKWTKEKANNKAGYTWKDGKNRSLRQVYEGVKGQQGKHNSPLQKKGFKPHMMYKGKSAIKANTYKKHLELKKKGYGHTPLNYIDSPLHFDWKKALDYGQTALTAAGTVPGFGIIADGLNTGVSLGRAGYAKATGDTEGVKEHLINAGTNAAMMVPVVGQGVAGTKLAYTAGKEVVKQGGKKLAKETGKKIVKKAAANQGKQGIKKVEKKIASNKSKATDTMTLLNKKNKPVKTVA